MKLPNNVLFILKFFKLILSFLQHLKKNYFLIVMHQLYFYLWQDQKNYQDILYL